MDLQAQLANLDQMIASGVLRSTYDGKTVEYRSTSDLLAARRHVAAQISGGRVGPTHFNPAFERGF